MVSLNILTITPNGIWTKEKNFIRISILPLMQKYDHVFFNISTNGSLNLQILMLCLNFVNIVDGNASMNKFARLSHIWIY